MDNYQWLLKMRKEDEKYCYLDKEERNKPGWQMDMDEGYRKIKAQEIIAWELIKLNQNLQKLIDVVYQKR